MKVDIVDLTCGGDGMYLMYVNDVMNAAGDYYIQNYMEGFADCAKNFCDADVTSWVLNDTSEESYLKYNERQEYPQNFSEFESELSKCE